MKLCETSESYYPLKRREAGLLSWRLLTVSLKWEAGETLCVSRMRKTLQLLIELVLSCTFTSKEEKNRRNQKCRCLNAFLLTLTFVSVGLKVEHKWQSEWLSLLLTLRSTSTFCNLYRFSTMVINTLLYYNSIFRTFIPDHDWRDSFQMYWLSSYSVIHHSSGVSNQWRCDEMMNLWVVSPLLPGDCVQEFTLGMSIVFNHCIASIYCLT